ncbi:MAG: ExeM/NucH family extracellular endonuclease [Bacteroidota bacterium]
MRYCYTLLALCLSLTLSAQEVILTGVLDGTLSGGFPRGVEIYVNGTVDLSAYSVNRYANGSTSATGNNSVTLSGTFTDEFVYLVRTQPEFAQVFGTSGDFANVIVVGDAAQGTGDDVYTIESGGSIIDQAGGVIGVRTNIYQDSWLYRNDNTGPDEDWVPANWMNVGNNNALDSPNNNASQIAALVPFGTYTITPPGPSVSATANGDLVEPSTNGGFTISLSEVAAGDVTVSYSLSGSATVGSDYADPNGGSIVVPMGQLSIPLNLTILDDNDSEPAETIEITLTTVSDMTYSLGSGATINVIDDEPVGVFLIHAVQGSGSSSPVAGQDVAIEGIVVGDFQGASGVGLGGFFVQEEDADADADPMTSEGIWVFDNSGVTDVAEGDRVLVTGMVQENSNLTQINVTGAGASVTIVSTGNPLPTAASLDLPVAAESDYEPFEGMRTELIDEAVVTEIFNLSRFGEFDVAAGGRLEQFTECNTPDPVGVGPYEDFLNRNRITVDDGRSGDDNFPIQLPDGSTLTSSSNTLRSGTSFTGLTGILDERFGGYRLQFTSFTSTTPSPRPAAGPAVGGFVKVVAMNVLNYFTTFNSRGANNQTEFDRQEAKIVAAICELDADIIGLAEIENNGFGATGALQTLIDAIQAECGTQYDFVVNPNTGGDGIQVALIYNTAVVEESGTAANLTDPAGFFGSNRVPLAQTFRVIETGNQNFGQQVTVCVNHWRSKGGNCSNTSPDDDNGGAGSCNGTRTAAATTILDWLTNTDPTGTGITDQLVIGDLNAYSAESPITTFTNAGWSNTVPDLAGACNTSPSFVFFGEWGSLDHALASPSLAAKVTGAVAWPVCAEEPRALDYNTENNNPALFAPNFYRFSDHNPVVLGLDLGAALPVELLSVSGEAAGKNVRLRWQTATEEATDRFEVQRQLASGNFQTIGQVAAAGNSQEEQHYGFTDLSPSTGQNIYRLRIVDQDGSTNFSDVVVVTLADAAGATLVQRPHRIARLNGVVSGAEYLLTNASGKVLQSGIVQQAQTDIDGSALPAGVYFLMVRDLNGTAQTFKIVW